MRTLKTVQSMRVAAMLAWIAGAQWSYGGTYFVTSAVQTVRFGIEQDWPGSDRLDNRHSDLVVYYCGGAGQLYWESDPPPAAEEHETEEAHAYASVGTREVMTAGLTNDFWFIGAEVGATFWNLNQNFMAGELFLGIRADGDLGKLVEWDPNDPEHFADFEAKHILVQLLDVRGPTNGYFSLFQFGPLGGPPQVYMSSFDGGIDEDDRLYYAAGGHDHYNWSFSQPGLYEVDLELSTWVDWDESIEFSILEYQHTNGPMDLVRWEAQPCTRYTLEAAPAALPAPDWNPVSGAEGISSAEPEILVTNQLTSGAALFYRVRASP